MAELLVRRDLGLTKRVRRKQETMKRLFVGSLVLAAALALFPGCQRRASNDVPESPVAPSNQSGTDSNKAATVSSKADQDFKTEMVQISGGRFLKIGRAHV